MWPRNKRFILKDRLLELMCKLSPYIDYHDVDLGFKLHCVPSEYRAVRCNVKLQIFSEIKQIGNVIIGLVLD